MKDHRPIQFFAGIAILGATAWTCLVIRGGFPPRSDAKLHQAVGAVMARQALNLLSGGGQVSVIVRDTSTFANPAADLQLAGFRRTLAAARVRISALHLIEVDPLRPLEVPPGDFCELMRTLPKGSVLVSFMGPPLLNDAQRKQLGETRPAVVAFCSGGLPDRVDLRGLFEQGLLSAAVVSRRTVDSGSGRHDRTDSFDRSFIAIDCANLAGLASR